MQENRDHQCINDNHWAALFLVRKTRDNDEQKIAAQYRQGRMKPYLYRGSTRFNASEI